MRTTIAGAVMAAALAVMVAGCSDGAGSGTTPGPGASPSAEAARSTSPATTSAATSVTATTPSPASSAVAPAPGSQSTQTSPNQLNNTAPRTVASIPAQLTQPAIIADIRTSPHTGFERIVVEFTSTTRPSATIQYVSSPTQCGSGNAVVLPGNATLEIAMDGAQAHDGNSNSTIPTTLGGSGSPFIQGLQACDFEGHVTWDFGLTATKGFTVSTLSNPVRIVIDIAS